MTTFMSDTTLVADKEIVIDQRLTQGLRLDSDRTPIKAQT
jgi:hypothetical protein